MLAVLVVLRRDGRPVTQTVPIAGPPLWRLIAAEAAAATRQTWVMLAKPALLVIRPTKEAG